MRTALVLTAALALAAGAAATQAQPQAAAAAAPAPRLPASYTNSIGMEFMRIELGSMQVGVFHPDCANGARAAAAPAAGAGRAGGAPAPAAAAGRAGAPAAGAAAPAGGRAAPARDPRMSWDAADTAACEAQTRADRSDGFAFTLTKPYLMARTEVTQAQWKAVMGTNPSFFQGARVPASDNHPVDSVTWQDAQKFVKTLNAKEKTRAYRLPSELEWEYACRAGGPGQQTWNDIRAQAVLGMGVAGGGGRGGAPTPAAATETPAQYTARTGLTNDVATKAANAWGLYDMLGNTWEWVADPYNGKPFPDARPPRSGAQHVLKGGAFNADVKNAICATHGFGPGDGFAVGFRVVKDVP